MPASRSVDVFRGLTAEVEPIGPEQEVYFTDQSPEFKLILRNPTDSDFVDGSLITWCLAIGSGKAEPFYTERRRIELPAGEQIELEIGDEVLAYEGHGVVGVSVRDARGDGDPDYQLRASSTVNDYQAVYSFSVWDRSQYESQHEYPQKLQRLAVYLTSGIVVFSVLSLLVALINLLVTLINAGFV